MPTHKWEIRDSEYNSISRLRKHKKKDLMVAVNLIKDCVRKESDPVKKTILAEVGLMLTNMTF